MSGTATPAARRRLERLVLVVAVLVAVMAPCRGDAGETPSLTAIPYIRRTPVPLRTGAPTPVPTKLSEPAPAFGKVVYRAAKVGSFESLGVTVIACRHRDPAPRRFAVEFFDPLGNKMTLFGASVIPNVPAGKKIVFVTDATHHRNRDVIDVRASHLGGGTARVISDARVVHCTSKMRFDPGPRAKTYWRSTGLHREGAAAPSVDW
jgi:hypothetical protein